MIIKEYIDKDTCNRNRLYARYSCDICGKVKSQQKRFLTNKHYCSPICRSIGNGTRLTVNCAHCNKKFTIPKSKLDKSKSGLVFCSRECKDIGQMYIKNIQPSHYKNKSYRNKALKIKGYKCNKCGNEDKDVLQVHHRDKNRDNNSLENLEVLCANCHIKEHRGT